MKKRDNKPSDELRPDYDLRELLKGGVHGKYAKRYQAGTNLILLDPDVRKAFRSERAVNEAREANFIHRTALSSARQPPPARVAASPACNPAQAPDKCALLPPWEPHDPTARCRRI